MTTREWLVDLFMVAWHLTTVVAVGGAFYVWAQRNRATREAFYAGVAEGKAIERLKIQSTNERREDAWDGGDG